MHLFVFIILTVTLLFSEMSVAGFDTKACEKSMQSEWDMLDCQLNFSTDEQEQEELKKKTYGLIYDISCNTHLNISKSDLIIACLYSDSNAFSSHTINCTVKSKDEAFKISLTAKPFIQFNKGDISKVQLNVGNITGDAIPLVQKFLLKYGNSIQLQEIAKEALNKFLNDFPTCPSR